MNPFISICIPAYKNAVFFSRLLDSIAHQSFKDFEVIVSDDSPDTALKQILESYKNKFPFFYYKNETTLGSPANWNNAIKLANGKWIKLMHHDDWFATANSLQIFAGYAQKAGNTDFIFSAHRLYEDGKIKSTEKISTFLQKKLKQNPLILFRKNYIGHPSTTLIRNNRIEWYDEKIKWVVDFEFYIRALKQSNFIYIDEPLVNIGLGVHQITKQAFRNRAIEIPENIYLLNKLGKNILKNVLVYDYYWRLLRNLKIREWNEFETQTNEIIPDIIKQMFNTQKKYSLKTLNIGVFSKSLMLMNYLKVKRHT